MELPLILAANAAYRAAMADRASAAPPARTPRPARKLVVLTCMDARLDVYRSMGLAVGDAHVIRNAGGRAAEALRSLVVSCHLLGTREIGIVHHTDCGLEGVTDDQVAARTGVHDMPFLGFASLEASVREDVRLLCEAGLLPADVVVWGAVHDVDTLALSVVAGPDPVQPPTIPLDGPMAAPQTGLAG